MDTQIEVKPKSNLKINAIGIIVGLILQYILGIITTLYVSFPEAGDEMQNWQFAWSQIVLTSHIILGLLLFLGSVVLLIRSFVVRNMHWAKYASLGFLFILISFASGAIFVSNQDDAFSLAMAIGFIAAIAVYGVGALFEK